MIKKINLDLKTTIALSILLCSNYYFFNDANFIFSHSSVIEVYFLLILFLLISFFIFKKFIDLILKLNFTVYVSLVYLFYTYFLVQIIKGFFYLSNYITIGVLISKIFDIDLTVPEAMFYKRFFIFFVPYIFCFIIIFSCKKNILKFLRFFTIVSYVFFVIVIFREIKTNLYSNINSDFEGIEFDLHQGEVLGFAGLVGSRRTDVGLALFGINPVDSGTIEIDKKPVIIDSPQQAQKLGVAYLSEDRRQLGLAMPMSITSNITLPSLKKYLGKLGIINRSEENKSASEFKNRLQIKTPSLLHEVGKLSGGNQQKVMLSKWLNTHPKIFILDEPTRGIDVGTKVEVHTIIKKLADEGMAIIFISSDLPEVIAMSDRILVMREGRQMGIVESNNFTQETIMSLAMGENIGDS